MPRSVDSLDECAFYQTTDVPGIGTVRGLWDLRKGLKDYLGGADLENQRVLEIGPASGFLTFSMEAMGAEVVCVELSCTDATWDCVPQHALDVEKVLRDHEAGLEKVKNAFWFCHQRFRSRARVHYGSAYRLPDQLGSFDVAVLGSVLLHCRSPVSILQECSRLVTERIIVTDLFYPDLAGLPVCRLHPNVVNENWHTWWEFSPEFFVQYLRVLGFPRCRVTHHEQDSVERGGPVPLFTVVASRTNE